MTSPEVHLNYWVIMACVILYLVLGTLWYGPLFGKQWKKAMGWDPNVKPAPEMKKRMWKSMLVTAITAFLMAWVMAYFVEYTLATTWWEGAYTAFWVWVGFQLTLIVQSVIYDKKSLKASVIEAAFQLVALAMTGGILATWI